MGAWIETNLLTKGIESSFVAPYVGAWIETSVESDMYLNKGSHPTWVRGLKQVVVGNRAKALYVAPYVGAWIETKINQANIAAHGSRTLRGCVD